MFSLRVVTTDHYLASPLPGLDVCYNEFRGTDISKVPVVRVYGITPAGQKGCMHVHGVFPYLYIPYDGTEPVDRYLRQLTFSIDKALNVALGRASSNVQHVYKMSLVSGITFYGYRNEEEIFVKIYLYNPKMVKKVSDLLLGGAIMNKVFQPYEAHIPYQLQMFIDYNLYGMNMLHVGAVKFRRPSTDDNDKLDGLRQINVNYYQRDQANLPTSVAGTLFRNSLSSQQVWDLENIPSELYLDSSVKRQSTCTLEVDVVAADILNQLDVEGNIGTNPGLAALWEDERQRRHEKGDFASISPPQSPERQHISWSSSEEQLQNELQQLVEKLQPFINESEAEEEEDTVQRARRLNSTVPSSQTELHLSKQMSDVSSLNMVVLDEEEAEDAIINEQSIHQVILTSQSFTEDRQLDLNASQRVPSQDQSLVEMLAALADNESPAGSQVAAHVTQLEDHDAVLSQHTDSCLSNSDQQQEDVESAEMSQRFVADVDNIDDEEQHCHRSLPTSPLVDINLQGMDQSWNSSQWIDVQQCVRRGSKQTPAFVNCSSSDEELTDDDNDNDAIPQLDGPVDVKSGARRLNNRSLTEKADSVNHPSKKLVQPDKEFVNGGLTSHLKSKDSQRGEVIHSKLDLRSATSSFIQQAPAKVSPLKSSQKPGTSPKAVRAVVNLSNMTVSPEKQTVNLLGAKPVETKATKLVSHSSEDGSISSEQRQSRMAGDQAKEECAKSSREPPEIAQMKPHKESAGGQAKSPSLIIRPGHLVPEKTFHPGNIQLPAVPKSCKIDLRSIVPAPVPPRPTASTKAKMRDWAAAMTSMDQHVYGMSKVKHPLIKVPNSRRMYSPVDSMMEQVVPAKGLKTYIPPPGIRTSTQNCTVPSIRDPGMIVDAELKAEGKENTKKPANRIYRKHVSGIIPKVEQEKKSPGSQEMTSKSLSAVLDKDRSQLTKTQNCIPAKPEKSEMMTTKVKRFAPDLVTDNKYSQQSKHSSDGKKIGRTDVCSKDLLHQSKSPENTHQTQHGEKHTRNNKKDLDIEMVDPEMAAGSSPDRNNIFAVVTPEVPESDSGKRSRRDRLDSEKKKGLDEQSAAKIVKGLLGFKKSLFSGKSKEELRRIQEKLNRVPGSKNTPVILDDDDREEGFCHGSGQSKEGYSSKVKVKRRRRRCLSSKSSKSQHTTGSEREASDHGNPDDYIIKGRRDSDSSADSDASLDLKAYVGAHQKTYEKPSYRVGDSFGKKTYVINSDDAFDKVVTNMPDDDGKKQQDAGICRPASDGLRAMSQQNIKKMATDNTGKVPAKRNSHRVRSWLIQDKKVEHGKARKTFSGLVKQPSRIPKRKPLVPGRIRVTSTSPVRYYHGRRKSILSTDSDSDCNLPVQSCTVQVWKDEYDEFINGLLGKECIVLAKLSPKEIDELKKQVKKEMEHKRTEHIMPLVMQKTAEEIEKEYEEVKRRVLEEMAKDPPMPDYVDSDVEMLESDSDKSESEKSLKLSLGSQQHESDVKERSNDAVVGAPTLSDASSDGDMPMLEPAITAMTSAPGVSSDGIDSNSVALMSSDVNADAGECGEDTDGNVTFVIMSQEEAVSEGVLLVEDATCEIAGELQQKSTVLPEVAKDRVVVIDLDDAVVHEPASKDQQSTGNKTMADMERWSSEAASCEADHGLDKLTGRSMEAGMLFGDSTVSITKDDDLKVEQREAEVMKQGSGKSSKAHSRRSSLDMSQDKGDVAEVDFSLLEMDTDNEGQDGSLADRELDTHKQLHTPPITIDSDQSQDAEPLITPKKEPEQEASNERVENDVFSMAALSQDETLADCDKNCSLLTSGSSQRPDSPVQLTTNLCDSQQKAIKKRKASDLVDDDHLKNKLSRSADDSVASDAKPTDRSTIILHQESEGFTAVNKRQRDGISSDDEAASASLQPKVRRTRTAYDQLKPCYVRLKRLIMSGPTMVVSECKTDGDRVKYGSGQFGAGFAHGIITDVVTEDSVDPLWEAHKQRLAVMAQPDRLQTARRQKGPPKHLADYVIPDGTLPTAPKKPSPRKKIRDPFVRSSSGRRAKKRTEQRKFLDKLSILHQYTLDSLNSSNDTGDGRVSSQSEEANSSCSNLASGTDSPISNPAKVAIPSYARDVNDDHQCSYDDVMYKLALLSPEEQAACDGSVPRPTSPTDGKSDVDLGVLVASDVPRHESAASTIMMRAASSSSHASDRDTALREPMASSSSSLSMSPEVGQSADKPPAKEGVPYTVKTEVVRFSSGSQSPLGDAHDSQSGASSESTACSFNLSQPCLDESPSAMTKPLSESTPNSQNSDACQSYESVESLSIMKTRPLDSAVIKHKSDPDPPLELGNNDLVRPPSASASQEFVILHQEGSTKGKQSLADQNSDSYIQPTDRMAFSQDKQNVCSLMAARDGDSKADHIMACHQNEESVLEDHSSMRAFREVSEKTLADCHADGRGDNGAQLSLTHESSVSVTSESSGHFHSTSCNLSSVQTTATCLSGSQSHLLPAAGELCNVQSVSHLTGRQSPKQSCTRLCDQQVLSQPAACLSSTQSPTSFFNQQLAPQSVISQSPTSSSYESPPCSSSHQLTPHLSHAQPVPHSTCSLSGSQASLFSSWMPSHATSYHIPSHQDGPKSPPLSPSHRLAPQRASLQPSCHSHASQSPPHLDICQEAISQSIPQSLSSQSPTPLTSHQALPDSLHPQSPHRIAVSQSVVAQSPPHSSSPHTPPHSPSPQSPTHSPSPQSSFQKTIPHSPRTISPPDSPSPELPSPQASFLRTIPQSIPHSPSPHSPSPHSPPHSPSPHSPNPQSPLHSGSLQSPPFSPSSMSPSHSCSQQLLPHSPKEQSLPNPPSHQSLPHFLSCQSSSKQEPFVHVESPLSPSDAQKPQVTPSDSASVPLLLEPKVIPQSPCRILPGGTPGCSPRRQSPTGQPSSPVSPHHSPRPQSSLSPPRSPSPQSRAHSSSPGSPAPSLGPHSPSSQSPPQSLRHSMDPQSPPISSWSLSPPRSPSPIQSPDPHRRPPSNRLVSHMPAVIPLTIEDPQIQEEVEKARRVKLMKLLGHSSVKPSAKYQTVVDPELMGEHQDPQHGEQNPCGQTANGQSSSSGGGQPTVWSSQSCPGPSNAQVGGCPSGGALTVQGVKDPSTVIQPAQPAPSRGWILETAQHHALGEYQASDAYCSRHEDVPDRPR